MRSYTIDVLVRESSSGYRRTVEGAAQLKAAERLAKEGRGSLVESYRCFAGYGGSYEVAYTRYVYTVIEK
jgi:hypothetical protein